MKEVKDNFSVQSEGYSKFRPIYPKGLYDEILSHVSEFNSCWDCGTGNGQMAVELAPQFGQVMATDISQDQLLKAPKIQNVNYLESRAESTPFKDDSFDLITVAQAVHWFDHRHFNEEVKRVGKQGGIIAIVGYGLMFVNEPFDDQLMDFYEGKIGSYWDTERKHIDSHYNSIPFPFEKIEPAKKFSIDVNWSLPQLKGYLETWSSVNRYMKVHGTNPVELFINKLNETNVWPENENRDVHFPLFVKLGRIVK